MPVAATMLRGETGEELQSVAAFDLVHHPQPDERAYLARELHDGLGQILTSLSRTRFGVRVEAAVYKIVEEALTNVMRHASARSVTISLDHGGGTLTVVIADDGDGFEPDHRALTPGSGMGLLCMEERGGLLDGTVRIQSAPGLGTVVKATLAVPLEVRR